MAIVTKFVLLPCDLLLHQKVKSLIQDCLTIESSLSCCGEKTREGNESISSFLVIETRADTLFPPYRKVTYRSQILHLNATRSPDIPLLSLAGIGRHDRGNPFYPPEHEGISNSPSYRWNAKRYGERASILKIMTRNRWCG